MARQFIAELERIPDHTHVLLITTGSVASIKAPLIVQELLKYSNVKVEVVSTKQSLAFFNTADVEHAGARVWTDDDEWSGTYTIGDPILHIELRRWADIVLVAPCTANTLAKIAAGLCDNLVVGTPSSPPTRFSFYLGYVPLSSDVPTPCLGTDDANVHLSRDEYPHV
ncbi:putative flavoprotein [Lanmaoa asiatica]|nr:putative flavoprotein [Lanmaoa asiatica]